MKNLEVLSPAWLAKLDLMRRLNNALLVKAILARIALDPRFHP